MDHYQHLSGRKQGHPGLPPTPVRGWGSSHLCNMVTPGRVPLGPCSQALCEVGREVPGEV